MATEYFQHGEIDITVVFSPCSCWQAWLRFGKPRTEPLILMRMLYHNGASLVTFIHCQHGAKECRLDLRHLQGLLVGMEFPVSGQSPKANMLFRFCVPMGTWSTFWRGLLESYFPEYLGLCIRGSVLQEDSVSVGVIVCCVPFGKYERRENAMPPQKWKQDRYRPPASVFSLHFSNLCIQNIRKYQSLHIKWKLEMSSHLFCMCFGERMRQGKQGMC